ncbi:hypothetical protein FB451DRAFT_1035184 [Mycena latifolia]|nr:hypothetical protein FB451DRAFT_1035184 [Mycena latifolia]
MEEEEAEADWELAGAASALILIGAEEARRLRAERRKPSRLYLCRPQLLRNPRFGTPWQVLLASRSDRAFITTMGFDVKTFDDIIEAGFGTSWYSTPIPREDVRTTGNPRPGARSLDAPGALGLVLHYLNSTMREISLQQIFALIPTTVSRYNIRPMTSAPSLPSVELNFVNLIRKVCDSKTKVVVLCRGIQIHL